MCPPPQPKSKTPALLKATEGAMTGEDYDLMLHCTIGHLRRVDGALPPFADGEKALNLLASTIPPFSSGNVTFFQRGIPHPFGGLKCLFSSDFFDSAV